VGITEQRAVSSKVSADGMVVIGGMAGLRGWWGLGSGAGDVRRRFRGHEVIRILFCHSARAQVLASFRPWNGVQCDPDSQKVADSL